MATILATNMKRGVTNPKIYDITRVFSTPSEPMSTTPRQREALDYDYEHDVLTFASAGRWDEGEWRKGETLEEHARRFKGVVAGVVKSLGTNLSVGKSEHPYLHPGIQASIKMGRNVVGAFGVIHPAIREHCDLRVEAFYAEMDARLLCKFMTKTAGVQVSDFPPITRDITLQVARKEQAGRVLRLVKEAQIPNLSDTAIVDDFQKSGEDFRRVTYRMTFQSAERTLKHDEVDSAMTSLLGALHEKHGVQMAV
jgi:phenylalanyl-tRNA synthetase beta chain